MPEAAGLWQPPPLGQVSGVTQGAEGSLWVLHRGSRTWDGSSWSRSDPRLTSYDQGIVEEVVLRIDQDTGVPAPLTGLCLGRADRPTRCPLSTLPICCAGDAGCQRDCSLCSCEVLLGLALTQGAGAGKQVAAWGAGQLYMPHSVTADREGNVWVTDVGLHVARKYSPAGQLLLELGKPGSPGSGPDHFCKPTDVRRWPVHHALCACRQCLSFAAQQLIWHCRACFAAVGCRFASWRS